MRYSVIKPNDVVNGVGLSVSLFTQGCPHHCKGCFNQETWNPNGGDNFEPEHRDYILNLLSKSGISRNLSLLGGEPLAPYNIDGVIELSKYIKINQPETIIYAWTGYTYEELSEKQKELLPYIDYLIDGQFKEELKDLSLQLKGSSNQRVIDIKKSLSEDKIVIYK